jgi:outer membrane protein assembly factor BamB
MTRLVVLIATIAIGLDARGDDWRQFRGSDSSGVSREANLPVALDDPATLAWKADLPGRGLSGPVVVGNRVFLTSSAGYRDDKLHVLCFSAETGEQLWDREFRATGRTICHETMCMATPQACSDGERIYAYYSCNDVICLDLDGRLVWYRGLGLDYPNASSSLGMSSSPVIVDGVLVLQLDTESESFAAGLNARTGETRWKVARARAATYASPALFRPAGDAAAQVLLQSHSSLQSVDYRTGDVNWELTQRCGETASTTVAGELLVAPLQGLSVLRPVEGDAAPELLWNESTLTPDTPTPVVYQDRVYVLKNSVLTCAELQTGKIDWRLRLPCKFAYASPVAGDGHLYIVDENGMVLTVALGGAKGEVKSKVELEEPVLCTPALAGGGLYLRSDKHLWRFAKAD